MMLQDLLGVLQRQPLSQHKVIMPIYEFRCVCGGGKEAMLSFEEMTAPQVCDACGATMHLKISVSNFTMKPTGRGMALDSLNSKSGGMPSKNAFAEQAAVGGL